MLIVKIYILAVLCIWLIAVVVAYGYGRLGRRLRNFKNYASTDAALPPLSIIIPAHNQAAALRRHLPSILSQDYDRFEIIVINAASTDDTSDVIERFELTNANLRHTFTPTSARDISLERLALTLGFKAATFDWVVITHPDCEPVSSQWLTRIGQAIVAPNSGPQSRRLKGEPDIVVGQAIFAESRNAWLSRKINFRRLWHDASNFEHILSGHAAMRADGCNMAYRKELFIGNQGFSAHQLLETGAEELLVNYNSTPKNTAVVIAPAATVLQDPMPDKASWLKQRIYDRETRHHEHHAWLYRLREKLRMIMPWLFILVVTAGFALPFIDENAADQTTMIACGAAILLLALIYICVKIANFNITARALGYKPYHMSLLLNELRLPFWNLNDGFARRRASRNEFRKKFV